MRHRLAEAKRANGSGHYLHQSALLRHVTTADQRFVKEIAVQYNTNFEQPIVKTPYFIHNIELTNKCIMRCTICPRTYSMTRSQGFMSVDTFKSIVDQYVCDNPQASSTHVWLHHFGESLLHPHFDDCIAYMRDKGLRPALSLNPIMLSKTISKRLLKSRPYLLYLSLDGGDETSFAAIRGVSNVFEQSKKNIMKFLEEKLKDIQTYDAITNLSIISLDGQEENIIRAKQYWDSIPGIDNVFVKPFTNWNGDVDKISEKSYIEDATGPCKTVFHKMTIAWDGKVLPCCYDYDAKYILGNVKHQKLSEIWNGGAMQALRKEFLSAEITADLCIKCSSGGKFFEKLKLIQLERIHKIKEQLRASKFRQV